MRRRLLLGEAAIFSLLVALMFSCATVSQGGGEANDVLMADEIERAHVNTAYEAVEKLRPFFLRSRGKTSIDPPSPGGVPSIGKNQDEGAEKPTVYIAGSRYGSADALASIPAYAVAEIRYLDSSEAYTKYGVQNLRGVIEVTIKTK